MALFGIVEEDVEVARWVAEQPEQQRDLPAMMHSVNSSVLHQVSEQHRAFLGPTDRELNVTREIFVLQRRQELANIPLDAVPRLDEGLCRWVVVRIEALAALSAAAAIQPAPFGAQRMHHRVPDGSIAPSHRLRELFRR